MSHTITFFNPGEIDPRLISTMGCNVKESDSPIGFFGTGLKYALAVLARENHECVIWSGTQRYELFPQTELMRGKEFQVCYLKTADESLLPLGFTTELGKQWTLQNAYRELYCNAKDEGGSSFADELSPAVGTTVIAVTGEKFHRIHTDERGEFLLEFSGKRKLFELAGVGAIYEGTGKQIFYKGVAVGGHYEGPAKFTYALEDGIVLSEDRQIKEEVWARQKCCAILSACDNPEVVKHSIWEKTGAERYFWFSHNKPGEVFLSVAHEMMRQRRREMNPEAVNAAIKYKGDIKQPRRRIELDSAEAAMLQNAVDFWSKAEVNIFDFPVVLVASIDSHSERTKALALAEDGTIWLTPECFSSDHMLRTTLFEEWVHLHHRVHDESRDMQNVLFDYIAKLTEKMQ